MTDTNPEAVERLIDRIHESKAGRDLRTDAIATLRAQQAEIARLTADRDEALGKALKMEEWSVEAELENVRLRRDRDAALAQVPGVVIHHLRTILDEAEHHLPGSVAQNNIIYAANKALDALTPADATAALDRIKRQARAEGMRKAAEMLRSRNVGMHPVYVKATGEDADAILAAADREERGDE